MKRNWEVEDDKRFFRKDLFFKRLDKLEDYIESLGSLYSKLHVLISVNDIDLYNSLNQNMNKDQISLYDNLQYMYLVKYFNDEELENCFHALIEAHARLVEVFKQYTQKIKAGEVFNTDEFREIVSKLNLINTYNNMIHRIDFLRQTYFNL